jgi:hypothetical protein
VNSSDAQRDVDDGVADECRGDALWALSLFASAAGLDACCVLDKLSHNRYCYFIKEYSFDNIFGDSRVVFAQDPDCSELSIKEQDGNSYVKEFRGADQGIRREIEVLLICGIRRRNDRHSA